MEIKNLKKQAQEELNLIGKIEELKKFEEKYLGKEGKITKILRSLKNLSDKERKKIGKETNEFKDYLLGEIEKRREEIRKREIEEKEKEEWIDITIPPKKIEKGHLHPLSLAQERIEEIFVSFGFSVIEGPEIENEWYNFDALNIPKDHPARDLWDTFWIKSQKSKVKSQKWLLRTHTSPVQVRYMEKHNPPLRIISPGRIFRYEATDASHEINFYQVEGLMIDRDITVANFYFIMDEFFKSFFRKETKIRLRPSFFPFTEPSFEIDIVCSLCKGKGCSVCSKRGWIELAGAGMVHPNVLKAVKIDPKKWQGFAFGLGLDRLAMIKYKINDIRLFYSGDLRFLRQF
ncbi:MAG: phenylalanine--tRNA ligase subunit alpha [Candidatus Pacebacteria bacterium]|nr:phenylalanine--tRNA ligase subunit alpha [Candidatus Paceibacterota bacterium]